MSITHSECSMVHLKTFSYLNNLKLIYLRKPICSMYTYKILHTGDNEFSGICKRGSKTDNHNVFLPSIPYPSAPPHKKTSPHHPTPLLPPHQESKGGSLGEKGTRGKNPLFSRRFATGRRS